MKNNKNKQPSDSALSVNYALVLSELIENWGVDSQDLLSSAGISKNDLLGDYINAKQYYALIEHALLATNEPSLGLHYGSRLNLSTHGLLGYAVLSSPSLEKTAEITNKYIHLSHKLLTPTFHFRDNANIGRTVSIRIDSIAKKPEICRFEIESSFASIYSMWAYLLGNTNGLVSLHLEYKKPHYAEAYNDFFDIPIVFESDKNEICFIQKALKPLSRLNNPTILQATEKQCAVLLKKLEADKEKSLSHQIKHLLLQLPGDFLSLEKMATHLNTTSRTLARKLATENTSYQKLLDQVKRDLALQFLTFTDLTIDEIAYALNYTDPSNFTRAFKRWTQLNPSEYRSKH